MLRKPLSDSLCGCSVMMVKQAAASLCIFFFILASGKALDSSRSACESAVKQWAAEQLEEEAQLGSSDTKQLTELLYFLHVPRTGGRTFYQCLLRNLYPNEQRCHRSYDKLRFDPRHPDCKLLTTHDDYSILTKLPRETTSVVTNLRHPLDRVFSTYEFSVEVAARFLVATGNQSAAGGRPGASRRSVLAAAAAAPVSTLDIWPWKYLVPFMRDDLFKRRDARNAGLMDFQAEIQDFYNVSSIAMPLHDFIQQPEAFELVHNGATFQVAGLTNNSFMEEAKALRLCIHKFPELGIHALQVAKERLNKMLYVGLTDRHEESAIALANMVGAQAFSKWAITNGSFNTSTIYNQNQWLGEKRVQQIAPVSAESPFPGLGRQQHHVVQGLLDTYHSCVKNLRRTQTSRKKVSLKNIAPIKYSEELRKNIPESLVEEILRLNSLDVKLYKHAVNIFEGQHTFHMNPYELPGGCPLCNTVHNSLQGRHKSKAVGNGATKQPVSRIAKGVVIVTGMAVIIIGMLTLKCFYNQVRRPRSDGRMPRQKVIRKRFLER